MNPSTGPRGARLLVEILALAGLYILCGRLGQLAAIPPGFVTAIWPASGLALGALILRGRGLWPGIALGSFLVNAWAGGFSGLVLPASLAIGAGAAIQALAGEALLRRLTSDRSKEALQTARGVIAFVAVALSSALVNATLGTTALSTLSVATWPGYQTTWWTWWLGDVAGILVLTPALLTWSPGSRPQGRSSASRHEQLAFVVALLLVGRFAFWGDYPLSYLVAPLMVWAAFRLGVGGATAAILGVSAIAIAGAVNGVGPFVGGSLSLNESLLLLQGFMASIVLTTVILAAVVAERERGRAHLEDEVAARTAELAESVDRLTESERRAQESERAARRADREKSRFLASMSHELRTPLNAILGYTQLMVEKADELGHRSYTADLGKVERSARHLLSLINEILDLSKIEAGKLDLLLEDVDVTDVAREIGATVQPLAEKNGNTLVVEAAPEVGTIRADGVRLRQILLNLLSNACKFTEKGSITLQVTAEGPDHVVLRVIDTGIGLTPEQQGRLFQAFVQADATVSRRFGGTGIGLVISRSLARMMGGDVTVESAAGKGTTFTVTIPRKGPSAEGRDVESSSGQNHRVPA